MFLPALGKRDITTSHEARIAQTARVMAAAGWPWEAKRIEVATLGVREDAEGQFAVPRYDVPPLEVNPWLVPVLNRQIRLQKPPLPNWCVAMLYRLLGVSEWATRLVSALFAVFAALLVSDLARLTLGRAAALPAGLVWISTLNVVAEFHESTPDPYLAFFSLVAIWAWIRASTSRQRCMSLLLAFYACLALGALAKGPFVFLHVAIALGAFHFCCRRRPGGPWLVHVAGFVLMLAIALPWPLYVLTHVEQAGALWKMEATRGGGGDVWQILAGSWTYFVRTFELALPWTPLWIVGIVAALRPGPRRRRRRRLFPLLWCAATIAVFSLSAEKKNAYLLPMMPAQTLIVATGFPPLAGCLRRRAAGSWPGVMVGAQFVATVGITVAGVVVLWRMGEPRDLVTGIVLACVAAVLLAAAARHAGHDPRRWFAMQAGGSALACVLMASVAHAVQENVRSAKTFARRATPQVRPPANVLLSRLLPEASFYLSLDLHYDPYAAHVLAIIEPASERPFDASRFRTELPDARIIHSEEVSVPGEPPNARWRLMRLTVEPDNAFSTNPAFPAMRSSIPR